MNLFVKSCIDILKNGKNHINRINSRLNNAAGQRRKNSGQEDAAMLNKEADKYEIEKAMREYLKQGRKKLERDLDGTKEAIRVIAKDKAREYILYIDRGMDKYERECLCDMVISCMYKSFCYGYGIGKIEGKTNNRLLL